MRIGFIGFGEVGSILARDLQAAGHAGIAAFDIAFADPASKASRNASERKVAAVASAPELAVRCDLIFHCVTAGSSLEAAKAAVSGLGHAPFFVDVNSVSPGTKRATGRKASACAPPSRTGVRMPLGGTLAITAAST
jgi:3-hydroxyisobutyrate dehydrogenase